MTPVLVACSHGTSSPDGRAAISAVVDRVRVLLGGVRVEPAFVDVQTPEVDDVVQSLGDAASVVVPLLLSTGFHTNVDIARAVREARGTCVATPALGPHPLLADLLARRIESFSPREGDAVVLAAAGSTNPAAAVDVAAMAELLSERIRVPVSTGFAAGAGVRIGDAVEQARAGGAQRVIAASYVLAPGFFADLIASAGADIVTEPLAPDDAVAAVVVDRYRAAVGALL
ncbi:sirohydrochlorin chelatase [Microbacterium dauci]|uniref:CbiX/SirB N-terminal domain-containing protein n=1 Tax=Microbacterium dauci TaxID=3048008 RepID=A0ABT6ZAG9_9MICO|nr:CbiX/SirB N-terminal domain-containing protein [Microbacterium sp. LX3-4]MDJ1113151.1 CbiX/SirB N-terminal domain-containing protein [Microbacterium sp. LX3-4]